MDSLVIAILAIVLSILMLCWMAACIPNTLCHTCCVECGACLRGFGCGICDCCGRRDCACVYFGCAAQWWQVPIIEAAEAGPAPPTAVEMEEYGGENPEPGAENAPAP